ncbi:GumC family protein [Geminocystis sp. CENA526]|uniref:GumC family protein n=1 Tax=Geminocystis sp. CENA526 TaxID=1355871 RepID=UPI003D6FC352
MVKAIPSNIIEAKSQKRIGWRIFRYLGVAALANGMVWGLALYYLKTTMPSYTSELILNVAGSGQGVNVNLPDIGQAVTSTTSAFGSSSDPRENYKLIASNNTVLQEAANSLKLPLEDFGSPQIKIINNTTTFKIEITGNSPEKAQQKAQALYEALANRLDFLRTTEQNSRNEAIQSAVNEAESKLTKAQSRLSDYKMQSGLSSSDQVGYLINTIEQLRKQRAELITQTSQSEATLKQLSETLQTSSPEASDSLTLQSDQEFQNSLKEYTQITLELEALKESRGENYPDVLELKDKQQTALNIFLKRGESLLGKSLDQNSLQNLNLDNTSGLGIKRGELYQKIVTLESEHKGFVGQLEALNQQIKELEARLTVLVDKARTLDSLLKEVQIAEAIFTSTLAKVDLGKSDPFGSFPLLQLIEEPSLPEDPTSPKTKLVIIGAGLGSILVTFGLTILWWRAPLQVIVTKIIKNVLE